jgi:hypothetical protein
MRLSFLLGQNLTQKRKKEPSAGNRLGKFLPAKIRLGESDGFHWAIQPRPQPGAAGCVPLRESACQLAHEVHQDALILSGGGEQLQLLVLVLEQLGNAQVLGQLVLHIDPLTTAGFQPYGLGATAHSVFQGGNFFFVSYSHVKLLFWCFPLPCSVETFSYLIYWDYTVFRPKLQLAKPSLFSENARIFHESHNGSKNLSRNRFLLWISTILFTKNVFSGAGMVAKFPHAKAPQDAINASCGDSVISPSVSVGAGLRSWQ